MVCHKCRGARRFYGQPVRRKRLHTGMRARTERSDCLQSAATTATLLSPPCFSSPPASRPSSSGSPRCVLAMERAHEMHNVPAVVKPDQAQAITIVQEEDRGPRPHRCNDRLEDFVQALFEGDPRKNLPGPAKLFWRCYKSKPGDEPKDPFFYLEEDANGKLVPKGRK